MLKGMVQKVVGTRFQREMKRLQPIVDDILRHEERLGEVSEEELKAQTDKFREIIRERTRKLEDEIRGLKDDRRHTDAVQFPVNGGQGSENPLTVRGVCGVADADQEAVRILGESIDYSRQAQAACYKLGLSSTSTEVAKDAPDDDAVASNQ